MKKNGQVKVWILIVVLVFFVALAWYVTMRAFIPVNDTLVGNYNETLQNSAHLGDRPWQIYQKVYRLEKFWPIALIVGLILLGILYSLLTDPNEIYRYQ